MTALRRWVIALATGALVLVLAFIAVVAIGFLGFALLVQSGAQ